MDKNVRIRTNVGQDSVLRVNLSQDVDFLEVLSLQLTQKNAYKLHTSNYGIIMGRVLANDAFGIPNAKVSVFLPLTAEDAERTEITSLYPYKSVTTLDKDNIRYNLLKDDSTDACYRVVGTFPNKRLVLDNDTEIEVYEKYWKYTTVTNQAGDYMIYGVPCGQQTIHVDIDLSDVGILSQSPRDFLYKGYNITQFDNPSQFKESTNLENLSQIIKQDNSIYVYPFWGSEDEGEIAITRCDVQIQYKFEPTCVFMGCAVTDNYANSINHKCSATKKSGYNRNLVATEGTIEMIRKTMDGYTEEFQIQGNQLIDGDGVWCYQIPMNLDYIGTDEFGNIIPIDNPNKGIPTRTNVRFRFSLQETGNEGVSRHRAKFLVPNNPHLTNEGGGFPKIENGKTFASCYEFGSATRDEDFRDLYWNKVYSVKSYVPRLQTSKNKGTQNYTALRTANYADESNPLPFNHMRLRLPFGYKLLCLLTQIVVSIIYMINASIISVLDSLCLPLIGCIFHLGCLSFNMSFSEETDGKNVAYLPGCWSKNGKKSSSCPDEGDKSCTKESSTGNLMNDVQQTLAQEYEVANLDFYNDWLNGTLYFPLWFWRKTKKKKFLFGLFSKKAQNVYCACSKRFKKLRLVESCAMTLGSFSSKNGLPVAEKKNETSYWHRQFDYYNILYGIVHEKENREGLKVYYYAPGAPNDVNYASKSGEVPFFRLYSTDIILLGSLNSCDMDGLPQFFTKLPSTTANIPEIKPIVESINDDDDDASNDGLDTDSTAGTIEITGMDWGGKDTITQGLFFDISCTQVKTRIKSCVNVGRMCELGVTYDTTYTDYVSDGTSLTTYTNTADGVITRYELVDNESRAMFASLNMNGLEQKYFDEETYYQKNAFKYTYPINFDGKLSKYIQSESNRLSDDIADMSYLQFRLGGEDALRYDDKFIVYDNSFFFYFGINEGNTAIDKFNRLFYADCFQNSKEPFSYTYEISNGRFENRKNAVDGSNNPFEYGMITVKFSKIKKPYSYILYDGNENEIMGEEGINTSLLVFGGVWDETQGAYKTYDDSYTERYDQITSDSVSTQAILGFTKGDYQRDGRLHYSDGQMVVDSAKNPVYLENGTYTLAITDSIGNTITQSFNLVSGELDVTTTSSNLKDNYIGENVKTERNRFCPQSGDGKYGKIVLQGVVMDGIVTEVNVKDDKGAISTYFNDNMVIKSITADTITSTSEKIVLLATLSDTINAKGVEGSVVQIVIEDTAGDKVDDWCCVDCFRDNVTNFKGSLVIPIFKPSTYNITITQMKKSDEGGYVKTENDSVNQVTINNGNDMEVYLDDVLGRWLIGYNAGKQSSTYNRSFYNSTATAVTDTNGWFLTHTSEPYSYPSTSVFSQATMKLWKKYVEVEEETDGDGIGLNKFTDDSIYNVLMYKLNNAFKASHLFYDTNEESMKDIPVTVEKGDMPILARSITPNSDEGLFGYYTYDSIGAFEMLNNYPTIVGRNTTYTPKDARNGYNDLPLMLSNSTSFNPHYCGIDYSRGTAQEAKSVNNYDKKNGYVGGYLAAFTLNGGYKLNSCQIDNSLINDVVSWPASAQVKVADKKICPNESLDTFEPWASGSDTTKNYFRTQVVDRRLDYSLWIYLPPTHYKLTGASSYGRIYGTIFNGVEMSYFPYDEDNERCIMCGTKDSYEIETSEKDEKGKNIIKTYYPEYYYDDVAKKTSDFHYNTSNGAKASRQLYNATLYLDDESCDIRKMIRNRDNYTTNAKLYDYTQDDVKVFTPWSKPDHTCPVGVENINIVEIANKNAQNYVSKEFPYTSSDVTATNLDDCYPTARHVNIAIKNMPELKLGLKLTSCSYDIEPEIVEIQNGSATTTFITASTQAGEEVKTYIDANDYLAFVTPSVSEMLTEWATGQIIFDTHNHKNPYTTRPTTTTSDTAVFKLDVRFKVMQDKYASSSSSSDSHRTITYLPQYVKLFNTDSNGPNLLNSVFATAKTPTEICNSIARSTSLSPRKIGLLEYDGIDLKEGALNTGYFSATTVNNTNSKTHKKSGLLTKVADNNNHDLVFDDDSLNAQTVYGIVEDAKDWEKIGYNVIAILTERCYLNSSDDNLLKEIKTLKVQGVIDLSKSYLETTISSTTTVNEDGTSTTNQYIIFEITNGIFKNYEYSGINIVYFAIESKDIDYLGESDRNSTFTSREIVQTTSEVCGVNERMGITNGIKIICDITGYELPTDASSTKLGAFLLFSFSDGMYYKLRMHIYKNGLS